MKEQTLILIKPDGLRKSLTGNILTTLSEARLEIAGAKVVKVSRRLAEKHYQHLKKKPFYGELIRYIRGELHGKRKVLALIYYGADAIDKVREITGVTNPEEANAESIRGKYGRITTKGVFENVIHASKNREEAEKEIKLWFKPDEIIFKIYPTKLVTRNRVKEKVWKR